MKKLFWLTAMVIAVGSSAWAQDTNPILRSSALSGSERLALYSYAEYLKDHPSLGLLNTVSTRMQRLAFPALDNGRQQAGFISRQGRIAPVLSYDSNINGGNRNSSFNLGGFVFEGDPDAIAKEGVVIGAEVGGSLRYSYGRGRYLDVSGQLSAVYSPEHDLPKYTGSLSICSRNHIHGWTFVDFCAGAAGQSTDLSDSVNYNVNSSVTQLFSFGGYDHEITGSLGQAYFEDYDQARLGAALTTSMGEIGSITVGFDLGEDVVGELHLNNRVYVRYNTSIAQRPVSFQFERGLYGGGTFFGQERVDETLTLGVRTRISDQISVGLTVQQNNSTVDFYTYDTVGFNVSFTGFQF